MRYALKFYAEDMGDLFQGGCRDLEDARWHVNSAREHDGLDPLDETDFLSCMDNSRCSFTPED